ncbi:hypothetical protein [Microbacterium arborescens]|uniref:hypothetical protein n=1 Tax=Microbacterium arborescens TaxID=33883 RepID=UPI00278606B4|nr:hypothetical protein [Microbacterium arborescens]MDQ1217395.1 hypothetical protein [Microbacterium arborescens]
MEFDLLLLAVVLIVIAAVTGTLAVVARDGYRRVPTDATRVPPGDEAAPTRPSAGRRRVEGSAEVSGRGAHGHDAMPRAVATPIPPR